MNYEYSLTIKTMKQFIDFGDKRHGASFKPDFCGENAFEDKIGYVVMYRGSNSYRNYWGVTKEEALKTFFKNNDNWK